MHSRHLRELLYGFCSALLIRANFAFQLQPIDLLENEAKHIAVRDNDYSKLDLLSSETFLWGGHNGKGRYALGNFTTYMPGKHESIIAMEKFYPLLKSTECTQSSMALNFEDDGAYRYGSKTWNWVNEAKNHSFLLVAGHGHCKWNTDRLPFIVTDVEFNDTDNTIKAIGRVSDWANATHSYDLHVGGRPASTKRDDDDSYTFDVSGQLPISHIKFGEGDVKFTYDCSGCGTTGEFVFDFDMKTTLGIPDGISLTITPNGVGVNYEPRLGVQAALSGSWSPTLPLGTISLDGISIAGGIIDLGPEIKFDLAGSVGPLQGTAGITGGGKMSLDNSASLTIDLLNPNIDESGWSTTFSESALTVDSATRGSVQLQLDAGIYLALDALDYGFNVGIVLQPFVGATMSFSQSSGDACPNDPGKHYAVKYLPSAGVNLLGELNLEKKTDDPIVSATLLSWIHTFSTFCTGLDGGLSLPTGSSSLGSWSETYKPSSTPYYATSTPLARTSSTPKQSHSIPTISAVSSSPPMSTVTPPPSPHSSGNAPPSPPQSSSSSSTSSTSIFPVVHRRHVAHRHQRHGHA